MCGSLQPRFDYRHSEPGLHGAGPCSGQSPACPVTALRTIQSAPLIAGSIAWAHTSPTLPASRLLQPAVFVLTDRRGASSRFDPLIDHPRVRAALRQSAQTRRMRPTKNANPGAWAAHSAHPHRPPTAQFAASAPCWGWQLPMPAAATVRIGIARTAGRSVTRPARPGCCCQKPRQ